MANTHESFRQDMQQEASDQFFPVQHHDFVAVVVAVVFVAKFDFVLVDRQDARIAERGFTAVAGQVIDFGLGAFQPELRLPFHLDVR